MNHLATDPVPVPFLTSSHPVLIVHNESCASPTKRNNSTIQAKQIKQSNSDGPWLFVLSLVRQVIHLTDSFWYYWNRWDRYLWQRSTATTPLDFWRAQYGPPSRHEYIDVREWTMAVNRCKSWSLQSLF